MDLTLNDGNKPPPPNQHPLADYNFSADEIKALRECNQESFFQRSLPIGTGLGLMAYFGVKNGYLQGNGKYGAVPKVVLGVIMGYFVGKFSYQQKCAEKIMRLPNSHLGELLRQRRQGGGGIMSSMTPDENLGRAFTLAPFTPSSADVYTDDGFKPSRNTALNLDTDSRPNLSGLDDIYRPTLDSNTMEETDLPLQAAKPGESYEDLRKRNREEFLKHQQSPYSRPYEAPLQQQQQQQQQQVQPQRPLAPANEQIGGKKNKYGDSWTD